MKRSINLEEEAGRLSGQCLFGECPACPDSMTPCPVMEYNQKSCMDIGVDEWIKWLKSLKSSSGS